MGWFSSGREENSVLKKSLSGGPHGVGDPADKSLRKVEREILIPKIIRDRTKEEKCADLVKVFGECAKREGLSVVFKCRKENEAMQACMVEWYHNPEFKEECTKQYLEQRTRYRETGIKAKRQLRGRATETTPP